MKHYFWENFYKARSLGCSMSSEYEEIISTLEDLKKNFSNSKIISEQISETIKDIEFCKKEYEEHYEALKYIVDNYNDIHKYKRAYEDLVELLGDDFPTQQMSEISKNREYEYLKKENFSNSLIKSCGFGNFS